MTPAKELASFIEKFTPEIAARTRVILRKMRQRLPGAHQLVYDNYNALAIGFAAGERVKDVVFSVAVFPRWVSLFFFAGGPRLPDPHGLLQGQGTTTRHVVLDDPAQLDSAPMRKLMAEALKRADPPIDPAGKGRLIIKSISPKQRPRRPAAKPK